MWAPRCAACETLLDAPSQGAVCPLCWDQVTGPTIRWEHSSGIALRAIGPYEHTLRLILHALKYDGRRSLSRSLGVLLRRAARDVLGRADFVVPVPLHWRKQWRRGFNQSDDIARHLGRPVRRVLRRNRSTPSQVTLPATRRHANVENAFVLARQWPARTVRRRRTRSDGESRSRQDIRDRVVAVVDDVYTTGATLAACAHVLKDAGAREVVGLTIAATPRAVTRLPPRHPPSAPRRS